MTFYPGQRVICVDDRNRPRHDAFGNGQDAGLRRGQVYTIVKIVSIGQQDYLHLVEFTHTANGWHTSRFIPYRETKTDISQFQSMLTKKPELADLVLAAFETSSDRLVMDKVKPKKPMRHAV